VQPGKLASRDPVALATAVAERFWGATPCGGQIAVLSERPLPPDLDATTDGWVTFNSSLGPNDLQAPASTYTQCTISLARWQWPTRAAMENDWNMFCLTVIHEVGHLLGHPHSLTPGSVMAPVFSDESSVPPICRTSGPPSARLATRPLRH
jgi:Matrixin